MTPSNTINYESYVTDQRHMARYTEYQSRYAERLRESDKVLIGLVEKLISQRGGEELDLLDVGCSTGNLLRHLRRAGLPLRLHGADLRSEVLAVVRQDAELEGVDCAELDIVRGAPESPCDLITFNAVLWAFGSEEFAAATRNAAKGLRPGGALLMFEPIHQFEQELEVIERTPDHAEGLTLYLRNEQSYLEALAEAGFSRVEFHPFEIPLDLTPSDRTTAAETHTVRTEDGRRLNFRGALFQPWCHAVAHKTP